MKLLIHDANILIDLIKTESVSQFFSLEYEMITTNAVLQELRADQRCVLDVVISSRKLTIREIEGKEDDCIITLVERNPALSYPDCTVLYVAEVMMATLLTGDQKLRTCAKDRGIEVSGIFWAFDEMLIKKKLTRAEYKEKLTVLMRVNRWLPAEEFEKRK